MAASSFSFLFCIVLDLESPAASPLAVKNLSNNDPLGPRARLDAGVPAGCFLSACLLSSVVGPPVYHFAIKNIVLVFISVNLFRTALHTVHRMSLLGIFNASFASEKFPEV